jgi:hypothetical protein
MESFTKPKKVRPVNLFTVPEAIAAVSGVAEVGMVTITGEEELNCFKLANKDNAKLASELSKAALVEVDGKPLSSQDGSVDSFWMEAHPKLRQLILTAYAELHATEEEDQKSFLKSKKVRVA